MTLKKIHNHPFPSYCESTLKIFLSCRGCTSKIKKALLIMNWGFEIEFMMSKTRIRWQIPFRQTPLAWDHLTLAVFELIPYQYHNILTIFQSKESIIYLNLHKITTSFCFKTFITYFVTWLVVFAILIHLAK